MKAAILRELNKPLSIEDISLPYTLDIGQVLVEVRASGICGAQIGEITGAKGADPYLPHLMGHEGGGVVLECGPGVKTVSPGDRVVMHWRPGSGIDADPYVYSNGKEKIGAGPVHTFCEQAVVSENRLTKISPSIPFDVAALMGCAVTTGAGLISNEAKLKLGQTVLVIGIGGVGLNVMQGALLAGAGLIYGVDIVPERLDMATAILNNKECVLVGKMPPMEFTEFDVVVDCTGNPEVINDALQLTAPGGKLILVGQPASGRSVIFSNFRSHYQGKTIMDSQGGLTDPETDIPRYLRLWQQKRLNVSQLIKQRVELDNINEIVNDMQMGKTIGRCIVEMTNHV